MGTAPNDRQYPAMPDPLRLARRSYRLLCRLGLDDEDAWSLIASMARKARFRASGGLPGADQWLSAIVNYAEARACSLQESSTDQTGDTNADR